jgi:hypothetical protein
MRVTACRPNPDQGLITALPFGGHCGDRRTLCTASMLPSLGQFASPYPSTCAAANPGSRASECAPWSPAGMSRFCGRPSAPLLLGFPLHCRCLRILRLDPVPGPAKTIGRIAPLRHDAPSSPSLQAYAKTNGPSSSSRCSLNRSPSAVRASTNSCRYRHR